MPATAISLPAGVILLPFLRIPAGMTHDFENRTALRAGVLNVFIPGGFEADMPSIVEWFRAHASG